jgi:hypothetical protein
MMKFSHGEAEFWGAHATRVLVSATRRNDLFFFNLLKVREGGSPSSARESRALPNQ